MTKIPDRMRQQFRNEAKEKYQAFLETWRILGENYLSYMTRT